MIEFHVPGEPQGKGRARATVATNKATGQVLRDKKSGRAIINHYTPEKTVAYESLIRVLAMQAGAQVRANPPDGPVELVIEVRRSIPDSWPTWKREAALAGQIRPTTKPDNDNVEKAVKDGCNGVLWKDDCQIVEDRKRALYVADNVGVAVTVRYLDAHPAQVKARPTK